MAQYDQILLFYDQLLTLADEMHNLIEKELFDDILDKMPHHDSVLMQIKLAKKCINFTAEQQENIDNLEKLLAEKEKENIDFLQKNMEEVKTELNKLKLRTKLQNAYTSNKAEGQGTIIDVDDSYRPELDN